MAKGYVDPNWPNPGGKNDIPIIPYGYTPNIALGYLGVVLFLILTIGHGWLSFRPKLLAYTLPLPISTLLEVVGYIARLMSAEKSPYNIIYYIIQYFFIVVAPVILAAGIYILLSRMIALVGREYSPLLSPKAILITFITADVVATVVQIAGAAGIGAAESKYKDSTNANRILLVGLAVQVVAFTFFLGLLSLFMFRARRALMQFKGLMTFAWVVVVVALLVYLRTIFRLAETGQGVYGYLAQHEVFFGVLEFAPIVVAILLLAAFHPRRYVERSNEEKIQLHSRNESRDVNA